MLSKVVKVSCTRPFNPSGYLEGVKTKDKAILKADKVSYKYPNTDRLIFEGATAYCTLSSRVACLGEFILWLCLLLLNMYLI